MAILKMLCGLFPDEHSRLNHLWEIQTIFAWRVIRSDVLEIQYKILIKRQVIFPLHRRYVVDMRDILPRNIFILKYLQPVLITFWINPGTIHYYIWGDPH